LWSLRPLYRRHGGREAPLPLEAVSPVLAALADSPVPIPGASAAQAPFPVAGLLVATGERAGGGGTSGPDTSTGNPFRRETFRKFEIPQKNAQSGEFVCM